MPATPQRIAFISQPYRKAASGPDATVAAAYGDLARETKADDPIETLFDALADTQAIADERLNLLKAERGRYQAVLPDGLAFALALDFSESVPTGRVVDPDRDINRAALITDINFDFRRGAVTLGLWG